MDKTTEPSGRAPEHGTPHETRREVLLAATGVMGAIGLVATSVPFVASLAPSQATRAAGAPVDVDVATLAGGDLRAVEWRSKPVWLMRRIDALVRALQAELKAPGGFVWPRRGSRFDFAGRLVKNVPVPTTPDIPDYRLTSATALCLGRAARTEPERGPGGPLLVNAKPTRRPVPVLHRHVGGDHRHCAAMTHR